MMAVLQSSTFNCLWTMEMVETLLLSYLMRASIWRQWNYLQGFRKANCTLSLIEFKMWMGGLFYLTQLWSELQSLLLNHRVLCLSQQPHHKWDLNFSSHKIMVEPKFQHLSSTETMEVLNLHLQSKSRATHQTFSSTLWALWTVPWAQARSTNSCLEPSTV